MNKTDLIDYITDKTGSSKAEAGRALDAVLSGITEGLVKDGTVALVGHGTYTKVERSARTGRNPRTGEPMDIPASTTAKFKPGKELKDAVNA
ncbi:MAG: HU family DNA-binding protein [Gammaproteobacteria bacterium]